MRFPLERPACFIAIEQPADGGMGPVPIVPHVDQQKLNLIEHAQETSFRPFSP